MSKIIDSLKKAEREKNGEKNSQNPFPPPANDPKLRKESIIPIDTPAKSHKKLYQIIATVAVGLALLLVIIFLLIVTLRNNAQARANTLKKLNHIEELLNKNSRQLDTLSGRLKEQETDLSKFNRQMKDNSTSIVRIEKNLKVQETTINNLTNAKNILYNKIDGLYKEVDKLKATLQSYKVSTEQ